MSDDKIPAAELVSLNRIATALETIATALVYQNKCMSEDGKLLIDASGSRIDVKQEV